MKKTSQTLWLSILLTLTLGFSVTSCKDTEDMSAEEKTQRQQAEQAEQANTFWSVVGQLVGVSQATDDYQNRTFEPTVGIAKSGSETVRIITANDIESAVDRFNSLIGTATDPASIDENTATYTYSNSAVGTLVWHKTTDGTSLATVDVNIRQVPSLKQLVYMTPEQMGSNANYTTCYYRFGDVISRYRKEDEVTEYWVCVRPSFEPEGKGESHWISVSPLPKANIKSYKASTKDTYYLPTNLGSNTVQMQNFAEMLYAIDNSGEWEQNVQQNPKTLFSRGIKMFNDFDKSKYEYHSAEFWQRVQRGWSRTIDKKDMWQRLFGMEHGAFNGALTSDGLHLLYSGYSWKWHFSNDLSLYEIVYTNGEKTESNMHKVKTNTISRTVIDKKDPDNNIVVDVLNMCTEDRPYISDELLVSKNEEKSFFGDEHYRFIVRNATGSELCKSEGGKYDPKLPITNFQDVYVYNKEYSIDLTLSPENSEDLTPSYGAYGSICPGTIIQDEDGNKWFCYSSWVNMPQRSFQTIDHKARFISLDNLTVRSEKILGTDKNGLFVDNEDLLPESEAPAAAIVLCYLAQGKRDVDMKNSDKIRQDLHQNFQAAFNIDLRQFLVGRDAFLPYDGEMVSGYQYALSVAYEPTNGRPAGTQPYLRYIEDSSGLYDRGNVPNWMKYARYRFFKEYAHSDRTLDLTHTFSDAGFVTVDRPIVPDTYSNCKPSEVGVNPVYDPQYKAPSFTVADLNTVPFDARLYNNSPSDYTTPYREHVLIVRYLEFDDPSGNFHGVYDDQRYTIVYRPEADAEMNFRIQILGQSHLMNANNPDDFPWCLMDDVPFDIPLYKIFPNDARTKR